MPDFDVIVIGAGTGGYVAAIRAAQLGLKTAVVEKQKALGGTCLLWGCIPTKALLEHAHALKVVQRAKEFGVIVADSAKATIDMTQVQTRKDRVVSGLTKGVEFASIFNRFGSDVTIVELLPRLVPVEDEAISAELEKSFRKQGITSHTGAKVTSAKAGADGVDVEMQLGDGTAKKIRADYLL